MQKSSNIGGQAVMEGIMMRNGDTYSVAVRKPDHTIEMKTEPFRSIAPSPSLRKIPIIRGMVAFVDSLVVGTGALMWSAEYAAEDEEEAAKKEENPEKEARTWKILMTVTVIISICFSVGLFVVLPYLLASLLRRIAYHGAEHKCINCIENGWELNVENVLKSSRRHKRCGTSFLLIVIVISVIAFLILGLMGITSPLMRIGLRLLLIPVIAGVSFEFLRVAGSSDNPVVCKLAAPGLALQGLVTREPDAEMAEVAISAVNAVFDWREWQEKEGLI